jgi:4Fe-4S ferredoxin
VRGPETCAKTALMESKAARAAAHPDRPGEDCKAPPGTWAPIVDPGRCEGKADCVAVCPYQVFQIGRIDDAIYRSLPLLARLKVRVHGMKTSQTVGAAACQACGLCVVACPEDAIRLARRTG